MITYLKNLVELRTKVASVFPFFYVLVVYLYSFDDYSFDWKIAVLFFISMLCLDMATTTLNHIAGFTHEVKISKYDQNLLQDMKRLNINRKFNYIVFITLVAIGVFLGLLIVAMSSVFVLLIGGLCVAIAITYSYGPYPLKNTCLGEIASGVTMGALIPLAFIFSQNATIFWTDSAHIFTTLEMKNIIIWLFVLMIPVLVIANIMLANNTCDIEKDTIDGRKTLPILIGQNRSITIWNINYGLAFVLILVLVVSGVFGIISMLSLIVIPVVIRNCKAFNANPKKSETFVYAVFNLQIILAAATIPLVISLII